MNTVTADGKHPAKQDVKRSPNEEAVETAQDNVTEGYESAGKASIISGKPDGDTQGGAGSNNDQGKSAVENSRK